MKIHAPEITHQDGKVRIAARFEPTTYAHPRMPKTAWFEFPEEYESFVNTGYEGFVIALLPFAMSIREDIEIAGTLSPRLAFHLKHYQQIMAHWDPLLWRVQIHCDGYRPPTILPQKRGTAIMFSGGVDGMYTLYENLATRQPVSEYQITHGIYLSNFDFFANKKDVYQQIYTRQSKMFARLGLVLIPASHNLYKINPEQKRLFAKTFSTIFAGIGHVMSNGLQRVFVASSSVFFYPGGMNSDLRTDQALSSEAFELVHDAIVEERIEKIAAISTWSPAQECLYVCNTGWRGDQNCGQCAKCVRTMAALESLDVLDHFSLFNKLQKRFIIRRLSGGIEVNYHGGIFRAAWKNKKWGLMLAISVAFVVGKIRVVLAKLFKLHRTKYPSLNRTKPN